MAIDFPDSPTVGQIFAGPHGTFTWDGTKWAPVTTGALGDAPNDGNLYGRKSQAWSQIPAAPAGALVAFNAYSASATITIPAGATKAFVEMWGGAGGSGGVANAAASGGSGAPGFLRKYLSGLVAGNTLLFTLGAAGAAGASGGAAAAGNGGASTLASGTQTISTLTANGSNGSAGASTTWGVGAGTAGGTATGGDFNFTGQNGMYAVPQTSGPGNATSQILNAGMGGTGVYCYGTTGVVGSSGAAAGVAGQPGGCQIWWYA